MTRWLHPTRGLVPPAQFIPIAEESGLGLDIGTWVLRDACTQGQVRAHTGKLARTVAVNISGIELQNGHFLDVLFEALNVTGLNPELLELELTESALMKHPAHSTPILKALKQRGVTVSVDNFGTGHSNLISLQKLRLDAIKIDRTLIRKLRVFETAEDLHFLWAHNCDEAVGYYFGQPVPAEQFGKTFRPQEFLTARNSFKDTAN